MSSNPSTTAAADQTNVTVPDTMTNSDRVVPAAEPAPKPTINPDQRIGNTKAVIINPPPVVAEPPVPTEKSDAQDAHYTVNTAQVSVKSGAYAQYSIVPATEFTDAELEFLTREGAVSVAH